MAGLVQPTAMALPLGHQVALSPNLTSKAGGKLNEASETRRPEAKRLPQSATNRCF
jgi:hypothetical protein